jgi:membrane peptidoglycan carboxypeptidase
MRNAQWIQKSLKTSSRKSGSSTITTQWIKNLLNYPEEQVTTYTPDVDNIIEDQLQERSGLHEEVNDDEADDNHELHVVSVVEAYRMVEMLERF